MQNVANQNRDSSILLDIQLSDRSTALTFCSTMFGKTSCNPLSVRNMRSSSILNILNLYNIFHDKHYIFVHWAGATTLPVESMKPVAA